LLVTTGGFSLSAAITVSHQLTDGRWTPWKMSWRSEVEERWRGRKDTSERRDPLPVCPSQLQRLFDLLVFPNLSADYNSSWCLRPKELEVLFV
jgi:hypothetical protein